MMPAICTVVQPGQARPCWVLTDLVSTYLTARQTNQAYSVIESLVQPGGGPPPHIHHREDELFYILEGTFGMVLGEETFTASANQSLFLPRGIVHTFKNIGDKPGRILTIALPGGFENMLAEASIPCTDPAAVPAVTEQSIARLQAACTEHGLDLLPQWKPMRTAAPAPSPRELWLLGMHMRILMRGVDARNSCSVVEINTTEGNVVPSHRHKIEDEIFYVIEGEVEFELEGRTLLATPGTFVHVPRGVLHGFRNAGKGPTRMADFHLPGGFDRFFEECGTVCEDVSLGPPKVAPDMEQFFAICRKHGMELSVPAAV